MDEDLFHIAEVAFSDPLQTFADLQRAFAEAARDGMYGIVLPSSRVQQACELADDSSLRISGRTGFPDGLADADVKRFETECLVDFGAQEIDIAMNLARLKDGDHRYVLRELRDVAEAADERIVKVFIQPSALTTPELETACKVILDSGCHFVSMAEPSALAVVRQLVGGQFGVKITGLSSLQNAAELVNAGATRLERRILPYPK